MMVSRAVLLLVLPGSVVARRAHRPNDAPLVEARTEPAYYGPPLGDACSGLWPLPQNATCSGDGALALPATDFSFEAASGPTKSSALLQRAFQRFHSHIFAPLRPHPQLGDVAAKPKPPQQQLSQLSVSVTSSNETLGLGVDESYSLHIDGASASLTATTVWGALHGLEAFSQLTIRTVGDTSSVRINSTKVQIDDSPRFPWRGIMIDTSRHWHPVSSILAMVDAASFNRMNVLHWHITDAQSFPLKTKAFPKLVDGAYGGAGSSLHYDSDDVKRIVSYAKDRCVRVVPEIDSPGHSASWQLGYPEVGVDVPHDWYSGMVDPTKEASFDLLAGLFGELAEMFDGAPSFSFPPSLPPPSPFLLSLCDNLSTCCPPSTLSSSLSSSSSSSSSPSTN